MKIVKKSDLINEGYDFYPEINKWVKWKSLMYSSFQKNNSIGYGKGWGELFPLNLNGEIRCEVIFDINWDGKNNWKILKIIKVT